MKVIGIAGWSGSGKTALIRRLLPELAGRGLKVSTMKHAHHGFDLDTPGKDSFEHRAAGATEVLISSARRFAVMHELRGEPEWRLGALLDRLAPVDLVLVEGFKADRHPKIEVWRAAVGKPPLHASDETVAAIVSDDPCPNAADRPVLAFDPVAAVADAVLAHARPVADVRARLGA